MTDARTLIEATKITTDSGGSEGFHDGPVNVRMPLFTGFFQRCMKYSETLNSSCTFFTIQLNSETRST